MWLPVGGWVCPVEVPDVPGDVLLEVCDKAGVLRWSGRLRLLGGVLGRG